MRRFLVLVPAALALAACGGGGSSEEADPDAAYVDALATQVRTDMNSASLSEPEARCFAGSVVETLDAAALERAGITPAVLAGTESFGSLPMAMPEGFSGELHAAVLDCGLAASLETFFVDELSNQSNATLSTEASGCVTGALDDNALALTIAASMLDAALDTASQDQVLTNSLIACPGALAEMVIGGLSAAGLAMTPEATACVHSFVGRDPVGAGQMFASGNADSGAQYGALIAAACPQLAG